MRLFSLVKCDLAGRPDEWLSQVGQIVDISHKMSGLSLFAAISLGETLDVKVKGNS